MNIIGRLHIYLSTLSIGGRLVTGQSRNYNIQQPSLNTIGAGKHNLTQ